MTTSMRMVHWAVLLAAAIVAVSLAYAGQNSSASNAKPADSGDSLPLGDWRGDSICVVRESACHDEKSLYHVARLPDKPGWVSIRLDKIVDGKPVTMGAEECRYDAEKRSLTCEFARGLMQFTVAGSKMEGTMLLTDKTMWRKINLKNDE